MPDRVPLRLTAGQERAALALRHGLHPAAPATTVNDLAAAHAGLHAARLPTPYVTLRSRLTHFQPEDLRRGLDTDGDLVKLRTCRRTLHIYRHTEAAVPHVATLRQRLATCTALVRRLGQDMATLARLAAHVRDVLGAGALPYRELQHHVATTRPAIRARQDIRPHLIRLAIKWLWESGELVYHNTAPSLHRERREFHLTPPTRQLDNLPVHDAITELLRRYLRSFGPASLGDFLWWSGLSRAETAPALARLRPELIDVVVDGLPSTTLLLAEYEPTLRNHPALPADHVTLLAYEDPTLKGYHATRGRYVDDQHRTLLFNSIGEARASIFIGGRCTGVWRFDRRTRTITHDLHRPIPATTRAVLADHIEHMTGFLRSEPS